MRPRLPERVGLRSIKSIAYPSLTPSRRAFKREPNEAAGARTGIASDDLFGINSAVGRFANGLSVRFFYTGLRPAWTLAAHAADYSD